MQLLYFDAECAGKYSGVYLWVMLKYELMRTALWSIRLWVLSIKSVLWFWHQSVCEMP